MLNQVFQIIRPKTILVKHEEVNINHDKVIIRPTMMAICHADQRYYQGNRSAEILKKKLPMAPIHEAVGVVVSDPTGNFETGQSVVMIPNQPPYLGNDIFYENYLPETYFLSSGYDGFMQEVVTLPINRIVAYDDIPEEVACLSEFTSVAVHAIDRFNRLSHPIRKSILIVGDGSLAYVVATSLRYFYPDMHISVVGRNIEKLMLFNFVNETFLTDELPSDMKFDHAFECAGGTGSELAINMIIDHIRPQGTVMLMGVSENNIAVNTRDILEKGLTVVGSSRSGRPEFEQTIEMMKSKRVQSRLKNIVHVEQPVANIIDIHRVFSIDLTTSFKTIFKWDV